MTAIQEFNSAFDKDIGERPNGLLQASMIEFANARSRTDIAKRLREHFDSVRVGESRMREILRPVVGYGFNEATGEYELNAAEQRESLRGGTWWIRQGRDVK